MQTANDVLKAIKETVPVYEGNLTLEREIVPAQRAATPELKIGGSLRYQVCDEVKCYVPETVPLVWTVRYEQHDATRAPAQSRWTTQAMLRSITTTASKKTSH